MQTTNLNAHPNRDIKNGLINVASEAYTINNV